MSQLYQRACTVVVDTLEIEGLRVQFKITKSVSKEPNTCDLSITNLSETSRSSLTKAGAQVIVRAGYAEETHQIFSGDSRTIDNIRQGADWVTRVQCGDGERGYRHARVAESFGAGTNVSAVLKKLAGALGTTRGAALNKLAEVPGQFTQGYTAQGPVRAELDKILTSRGYEWSIQDGELRVMPINAPTPGTVLVLSPSSGLVGSPEHAAPAKKGQPEILKAKSLLNGAILPGGRVRIQAAGISGDFRVQRVTHTGDTAGAAWYSDLEAIALGV